MYYLMEHQINQTQNKKPTPEEKNNNDDDEMK